MSVRKLASLLCGIILIAGITTGCGSGDNTSTETNLAKIPLPKDNAKNHHAQRSRFQNAQRSTSPRLLPNGMPG